MEIVKNIKLMNSVDTCDKKSVIQISEKQKHVKCKEKEKKKVKDHQT